MTIGSRVRQGRSASKQARDQAAASETGEGAEEKTDETPLLVGRVLASKYRIVGRLGEGGMGVVYAGEHLELKTRVAIKVLQPELAEDTSARARFLREARLAASITSEHSTRILDVGTDDGLPYIVMERLFGETVSARLAREGRMSVADAATIMIELLEALSEAHDKGVVHRDLKPANLFLVERPGEPIWVKVLDFGISKVTAQFAAEGKTSITLTEPRTILGSPEYMSPEQLRDSTTVDRRSDLWSCGVVLFELLSGKVPFEGPSLADLCARIISAQPRSLASVGAESVPSPVAKIIDRCLRADPDERPQNALDLAVALAPYATDSARALLPRIGAWCRTEGARSDVPRSRRMVLGLGIIGAAGVLAFAAASLTVPSMPSSASSQATRLEPVPSVPKPLDSASNRVSLSPAPTVSSAAQDAGALASGPATSSSAAPTESARARPRPPTPAPGKRPSPRIRDADGIELIQ